MNAVGCLSKTWNSSSLAEYLRRLLGAFGRLGVGTSGSPSSSTPSPSIQKLKCAVLEPKGKKNDANHPKDRPS